MYNCYFRRKKKFLSNDLKNNKNVGHVPKSTGRKAKIDKELHPTKKLKYNKRNNKVRKGNL